MGDTQIDIEPVSTAFNFSSLLPELSFSDMDTVLASVESEYLQGESLFTRDRADRSAMESGY